MWGCVGKYGEGLKGSIVLMTICLGYRMEVNGRKLSKCKIIVKVDHPQRTCRRNLFNFNSKWTLKSCRAYYVNFMLENTQQKRQTRFFSMLCRRKIPQRDFLRGTLNIANFLIFMSARKKKGKIFFFLLF